jgi:hypothetical protein
MNAFQKEILNDPFDGHTEICDKCGSIIRNWDFIKLAWVSQDGINILCGWCHSEEIQKKD